MAKDWAKSFYNSDLWKQVRRDILDRDGGFCVACGAIAAEVHHITELTPENIHDPEISINPANLISLCGDCHKAKHRRKRAAGRVKALPDQRICRFDANGNPLRD